MGIDLGRIADGLNRVWDTYPFVVLVCAVLTAGVGLLITILIVRRFARAIGRSLRRLASIRDLKLHVGFAVVQAGVAAAVITGVYEAATEMFDAGPLEAIVISTFAEAAVWVSVGRIRVYARNHPGAGLGIAARLFWISTLGGGAFAAIGSSSVATAAGRLIIVALGTAMWWERIREWVPATSARSRWRWTPRRLGLALGALAPDDSDIDTEAREWQIRRLARAIRWNNASGLRRRIGGWVLTRRAETTTEDILAEARRRAAAAWVLRDQSRIDSPVMAAVVREVEDTARRAVTGQPGPDSDRSPQTATAGHDHLARAVNGADIHPDMSGRWGGQRHPVTTLPGADTTPGHHPDKARTPQADRARTGGADRPGQHPDTRGGHHPDSTRTTGRTAQPDTGGKPRRTPEADTTTPEERLVRILRFFEQNPRPTKKQIAAELGTDDRQIRRHLAKARAEWQVATDEELLAVVLSGGGQPGGHGQAPEADSGAVNGAVVQSALTGHQADSRGGHRRTTPADNDLAEGGQPSGGHPDNQADTTPREVT